MQLPCLVQKGLFLAQEGRYHRALQVVYYGSIHVRQELMKVEKCYLLRVRLHDCELVANGLAVMEDCRRTWTWRFPEQAGERSKSAQRCDVSVALFLGE